MPTCDYCDGAIEPGAASCPHCHAPRDPSGDGPAAGAGAPPTTTPQRFAGPAGAPPPGAPPPPPGPPPSSPGAGLSGIVQGLQSGDVGGVTRGLQDLVSSGHIDTGKLAADLGVGGRGLDLGAIARSLTSGGPQANSVIGALSSQGGGIADLLKSAAGALKTPAGLAVGGAALAVGAVGAGYLIHKARGGGSISESLGAMIPGGGSSGGIGGTIGSLLGTQSGPSEQDRTEYSRIAEQLPPAAYAQLREGQAVLARWDPQEWRPGTIGWVDGGQARVTFESGLERWCEPSDIRLPPAPGQPPAQPAPHPGPTPDPGSEQPWAGPGAQAAMPTIGSSVTAQSGPDQWQHASIVDTDQIGGRVRVHYDNGFECWLELAQIRREG